MHYSLLFSPVHPGLILPLCLSFFKGKPDLNTSLPVRQTASIFKQPVTKVTNHPNNKVKTDPQKAVDQPRQVNSLCLLPLISSHTNLKQVLSDTVTSPPHSFFGRRNSVVLMLMTLQRSWWKQWNCLKACKVIHQFNNVSLDKKKVYFLSVTFSYFFFNHVSITQRHFLS